MPWLSLAEGGGNILRFILNLYRWGYETYLEIDDAIAWSGWRQVGNISRAKLTRQFLAALFKAKWSTIKRDLQRSTLKAEYRSFEVSSEFQDYLDGGRDLKPATVYERGWYTRLVNGRPDKFVRNMTFFPPTQ